MFLPQLRPEQFPSLIPVANLKVLYGEKVEILTIYIETEDLSGHQAIAATSHSPKATWSKFLHSPLDSRTEYALRGLLLESEKELAKLFVTNGNKVPFDGEMTQNLTDGCGQHEVLDSPASQKSNFVFVATPVASLPDLHNDKEALATLNSPVDEMYCKEPIYEALICERPICEEPVCEEPVFGEPSCGEPVYDETIYGMDAMEKSQPMPDKEDWWGSLVAKKGKKGKKRGKKNFEEVEVFEESVPEPEPVSNETIHMADTIEEPQPIPDEDYGWASLGSKKGNKGKKRGKKDVEEVEYVEESVPEPEPVLSAACHPEPVAVDVADQDSSLTWGMSPKEDKEEQMRSTFSIDGARTETMRRESEIGSGVNQVALPLATGILTPTASRSSQTVIFTIRHSSDLNIACTREVMLSLTDNTYAAICEAVSAYLDTQDSGLAPKRTLQIKSGMGRNGKVDLSAIEASMWPVYMEYFCQYTKLPELTVDVLDS